MTSEIKEFCELPSGCEENSRNTEISYQRDLMQLAAYLEDMITEVAKVTRTSLNSYILFGKRGQGHHDHIKELASIKAFSVICSGKV